MPPTNGHPSRRMRYRLVAEDPGYRVGTDGSVWSRIEFRRGPVVRYGDWKRLKPTPNRDGYLFVKIRGRNRRVHRLVLEAFVGPCPPGMECRHLDDDPRNNRLDNLAWGDPRGERRRHFPARDGLLAAPGA